MNTNKSRGEHRKRLAFKNQKLMRIAKRIRKKRIRKMGRKMMIKYRRMKMMIS